MKRKKKVATTKIFQAGEIVQLVKVLATQLDDLSLILGTHVVEGENRQQQIALRSSHVCCSSYVGALAYEDTHTLF